MIFKVGSTLVKYGKTLEIYGRSFVCSSLFSPFHQMEPSRAAIAQAAQSMYSHVSKCKVDTLYKYKENVKVVY